MELVIEDPLMVGDHSSTLAYNSTVILGLPSFGNVGLMSVDLILATLSQRVSLAPSSSTTTYSRSPKRLGHLRSALLQPIMGFESFDGGNTRVACKSLEVYSLHHSSEVVYAIIQRSLCKPNNNKQFIKDLSDFIKASQVKNLYVVTSASLEFVDINRGAPYANYFHLSCGPNSGTFPSLDQWASSLPSLNPKVLLASTTSSSSTTSSNAGEDDRKSLNRTRDEKNGTYTITSDTKTNEPICISEDDQGKAPLGMQIPKLLLSEVLASNGSMHVTIIGKFVNEGKNFLDSRDLSDSLLNCIADEYGAVASSSSANTTLKSVSSTVLNPLIDDSAVGMSSQMRDLMQKDIRMRQLRIPASWQQMM